MSREAIKYSIEKLVLNKNKKGFYDQHDSHFAPQNYIADSGRDEDVDGTTVKFSALQLSKLIRRGVTLSQLPSNFLLATQQGTYILFLQIEIVSNAQAGKTAMSSPATCFGETHYAASNTTIGS